MPNAKRRKATRLGDIFGGLLGNAVKAQKGQSKRGKSKKTRKQVLDSI